MKKLLFLLLLAGQTYATEQISQTSPSCKNPELDTQAQGAVEQLWQDYMELGMLDELLTELETEARKGDAAREAELTRTLLAHWEAIMKQRRLRNSSIHWDGDSAYGSISYRTQDLPHELLQQRLARQNRTGKLTEEEKKRHLELFTRIRDYIDSAPNAEKIDQIIQHIYQEEYPEAARLLAQLRQEHPDYCPQAFAELAAALATPNRLQLLLLCTRLPLGIIRETHIVE
jgi:hypothetical protein